ncbi:hypothetical protein FA13DRAFT_760060 [Coprinellus micaceus]|uniref:Uncharacterized protein n=1 Tax=Coprinellus micaceus TaxID=71717 RepID=A0A4Y7T4E9_COPMI|nr:hypothetical protein FA13DRAFT_760060 [Coprinellus micaceus]
MNPAHFVHVSPPNPIKLSAFESFVNSFEIYRPRRSWRLLSYFSARDLVRLGKTSAFMRTVVKGYAANVWNINKFLACWFNRPVDFRSVLALTGAVTTGSQVIQFFDRRRPRLKSDLDIFTRVAGALPLTLYLEADGYRRKYKHWPEHVDNYPSLTDVFSITSSRSFVQGGPFHGIVKVLDFEKAVWLTPGNRVTYRKVQVVVVNKPPIEQIILNFHSTGVMNYISHKQAVSIFPYATFEDRIFYPSRMSPLGSEWKTLVGNQVPRPRIYDRTKGYSSKFADREKACG